MVQSSSPVVEDGAKDAFELVVFFGDETRVFSLPKAGEVTLGRAEDNWVRIDHASVSRHHARLRLGVPLVIEDLGGANGTCVRDARGSGDPGQTQGIRRLVRDRAEIAVGDCVLLGTACAVVRHAQEPAALSEADRAPSEREQPELAAGALVLCDPSLRAVYAEAERAARAAINVLLLGETGVGKEVLARAIHAHSPRARGPFMGINCGAFAEALLDGELFGYERGAFTGAVQARPGLFEAANGGTIFLDEVGDALLPTQVKLLRVVEERSVLRLGSRRAREVDVRIVSATNRDLEADTQSGRFRQDLYFRLAGVTLTIPPLRQRLLDIEPLARRFATLACRQLERSPVRISAAALRCLQAYAWPGNVRELKNVVERSIILSGASELLPEHLPSGVRDGAALGGATALPGSPTPPDAAPPEPSAAELDAERFRANVKALDRERVREALARASGNQTQAARLLGISRRTLVSRLREFDLPRPRKRGTPR